jgi:membrane fusion protein, multidrug efflux system
VIRLDRHEAGKTAGRKGSSPGLVYFSHLHHHPPARCDPMKRLPWFALPAGLLTLAGCAKPPPPTEPAKPAVVLFDRPSKQTVREYEDFTGRLEATNSVEIRAQVTGYLDKVHFEKDGIDVPEGAPLFDIDSRMYASALDQTKAAVAQAQAKLDKITRDFDRIVNLGEAASKEEKDRVSGDRAEAAAAVAVAKASQAQAETNLGYTKITARFAGRLSRRMVDPGNVVKANDTLLTTLVALDPIYATFDVDERTVLRIRRLIQDGRTDSARDTKVPVEIGLSDEDGFPHPGVITFSDNRVDPNTGTLRVRATLANVKTAGKTDKWLLSPGLFVRVRVPIGRPREALLVPEEAIGTDQGYKFAFVVDDKDEVQQRRLKLGQQYGPLRAVEEGITAADRVIVSGLQRVRRGVKVSPKPAEPASAAKAEPAPAPKPTAGG